MSAELQTPNSGVVVRPIRLSPAPRIFVVMNVSAVARLPRMHQRAHFLQAALHRRAEVFHQEGKSGKRPVEIGAVRARIGDGVLKYFDDARQRGIDLGDAGGGLRGQFRGRQFTLRDARGQRNAVVVSPFVPAHRQVHAIGPLGK